MTTQTDGNADKPLVLVVDDFQDNREMYCEYLEFAGFRVIEAANGQEAVDQAFEKLPDVIIMDLSLPVMDGWEATRLLKGDARTSGERQRSSVLGGQRRTQRQQRGHPGRPDSSHSSCATLYPYRDEV